MKRFLFLLPVLALSLALSSCKDTHDYTPAILEISEDAFDDCFDVANFNAEHDSNLDQDELKTICRHRFTHVHVSYNGNALGVWELPCEVPILDVPDADSVEVTITPCFKKNGQSSMIKGYGYMKSYKIKTRLRKGETSHLTKDFFHKKYEYHKYTEFKLIATFLQNKFSPRNPATSVANFSCVPDDPDNPSNPGDPSNRIGVITLTGDSLYSSFEVASSTMRFDVSGLTYLEIRYKCDNDMNIELYAPQYFNQYACGGLFATDEWQTVYVNLDERLGSIYSMGSYFYGTIDAQVVLSGSCLDGKDTHYYVDYVKVVTGPQP